MTAGVVTAVTYLPPEDARKSGRFEFLYTGAAVNPGVSGGPLLDATGGVIGVSATGNARQTDSTGNPIGGYLKSFYSNVGVGVIQVAAPGGEIRIRRREKSVEEQETQLAAHLDERHRKLIELRDQIGLARTDFEADRDAKSRDMAEIASDVRLAAGGPSELLQAVGEAGVRSTGERLR